MVDENPVTLDIENIWRDVEGVKIDNGFRFLMMHS